MIDIMFFLLVFFILAMLHMVNIKAIDIALPHAAHAQEQINVNYVVTLEKNGNLSLEEKPITREVLLQRIKAVREQNKKFSLVIRVEKDTNYNLVMKLLDECKAVGVEHVGLAAAKDGSL